MMRIDQETIARLWEALQTAATAWAAYQLLISALDAFRRR